MRDSRLELTSIRASYSDSIEYLRQNLATVGAGRARLRAIAALPSTLINYSRRNEELEQAYVRVLVQFNQPFSIISKLTCKYTLITISC